MDAQVITPQVFADLFKSKQAVSGEMRFDPRGVCGRFVRGVKPEDFEVLSEEPGKKLAFVCDETVLRRCLQCSTAAEMMVNVIGFDINWMKARLKDGTRHKLIVFFAGDGDRFLVTWENLLMLTERVYGREVHTKLAPHLDALKTTSYETIDPVGRLRELSRLPVVDKYAHPEYMTAQRYLQAEDTLYSARGFYYHSLGANLRFSGTGILSGSGEKEYCVINRPICELEGVQVIDLEVTAQDLAKVGRTRRTLCCAVS